MPARVAIFSTPRSANDPPSRSSSSVARRTAASIAARLGVLVSGTLTEKRVTGGGAPGRRGCSAIRAFLSWEGCDGSSASARWASRSRWRRGCSTPRCCGSRAWRCSPSRCCSRPRCCWPRAGPSIERRLDRVRVQEGEPLHLRVRARAGRGALVAGDLRGVEGGPVDVRLRADRRWAEGERVLTFPRRGRLTLPPPVLELRDPLGLGLRRVTGDEEDELLDPAAPRAHRRPRVRHRARRRGRRPRRHLRRRRRARRPAALPVGRLGQPDPLARARPRGRPDGAPAPARRRPAAAAAARPQRAGRRGRARRRRARGGLADPRLRAERRLRRAAARRPPARRRRGGARRLGAHPRPPGAGRPRPAAAAAGARAAPPPRRARARPRPDGGCPAWRTPASSSARSAARARSCSRSRAAAAISSTPPRSSTPHEGLGDPARSRSRCSPASAGRAGRGCSIPRRRAAPGRGSGSASGPAPR